jgi:hypothetical protein
VGGNGGTINANTRTCDTGGYREAAHIVGKIMDTIGKNSLPFRNSAASAVAAAVGGDWARGFSAVAAVLTAVLGFVQPERRYLKFVRAWRVLDSAAIKFRLGQAGIKELIEAVDRGEALITEFEEKKE